MGEPHGAPMDEAQIHFSYLVYQQEGEISVFQPMGVSLLKKKRLQNHLQNHQLQPFDPRDSHPPWMATPPTQPLRYPRDPPMAETFTERHPQGLPGWIENGVARLSHVHEGPGFFLKRNS